MYDGADLVEVGELTGLGAGGVVAAHTEALWTVAFGGFAPGFGYLVTDSTSSLTVPRRRTSRPRIPAGAVGLAGEFSGVYPRTSPGGWQLIGRTAADLWRLDRDPPALLGPGTTVRFRPVDELPHPPLADEPVAAPEPPSSGLLVIDPGPLSTVQDLGRTGYAALGVPDSGAADAASAIAANRLVGNPDDAAVLEVTLGRARLRAVGDQVVGIRGALPRVRIDHVDGRQVTVDCDGPVDLPAGATIRLGGARTGLRTYVAVAGGFAVVAVLGSRSTDTLSGLGPARLSRDDLLPVGPRGSSPPDPSGPDRADRPGDPDGGRLRLVPGPRAPMFAPGALQAFVQADWTVLPDSDRVGLRLSGDASLERTDPGELPSEGLVRGAIQIPPSGEPVLFLADHPVTGGYPVLAVVRSADLHHAAQARPGAHLRFRLD